MDEKPTRDPIVRALLTVAYAFLPYVLLFGFLFGAAAVVRFFWPELFHVIG